MHLLRIDECSCYGYPSRLTLIERSKIINPKLNVLPELNTEDALKEARVLQMNR